MSLLRGRLEIPGRRIPISTPTIRWSTPEPSTCTRWQPSRITCCTAPRRSSLTETVEYDGETFEAGTYTVEVDGKYWTDFDRMHPLEGPAREQAWSGTAHGLIGELGVGTVTSSTLQMGLGLAALLAGLGAVFMLTGGGLIWAGKGENGITIPDSVPDALVTGTANESGVPEYVS